MFRFVAFAWAPEDEAAAQHATDMAHAVSQSYGASAAHYSAPGLRVYSADARGNENAAYEFADDRGVILGKLFHTSSRHKAVPQRFGEQETQMMVASGGRDLVACYWGRYVAFIRPHGESKISVLRDPSGTLPCFYFIRSGVTVFFSYIEDCIGLGSPFLPHWDHLRAHVVSAINERLSTTALAGVETVQPGQCVSIQHGTVSSQFYWDPYVIASTNVIEDVDIAAEMMRETVSSCVRAWASAYTNGILLRLSGGLDSSIVAACLGDVSHLQVTCFTHHSPGAASDERDYARAAASLARLPLIEYERRGDVRLDRILNLVRHPLPFYARYSVEYGHAESALAREHGADAIFSGEWGDLLFYVSSDMHPAIDAAWLHGISRQLFGATLDTARREGQLYWKVLAIAFREGILRRRTRDPWPAVIPKQRGLLADDVRDWALARHPYQHPWRDPPRGTPMGKFMQIYESMLHDYQPFYDPTGFPSDPDQVAPLNSQPLIELCLRIPTFIHNKGGWERSIARRAFLQKAARSVMTRRTKGAADDHLKAVLARNISFVRSTLLEGQLVQRQIIDRKRLEEVLSGEPTTIATAMPELYWYLCNEVWLSKWH